MRRPAPEPARRITLLTDFGTADGYVAAMRGVIAGIAAAAVVEDATHEVPPGDVQSAAFVLLRYARFFPPGTVHLVVIDPGVGTTRRALAASLDEHLYVAPDNGVLSCVLQRAERVRMVELREPLYRRPEPAPTFHGRDIFAPAAAHLASGVALDALGPEIDDPVRLRLPRPSREGTRVNGVVLHVDRFGNLISNIPHSWIDVGARVSVGSCEIAAVHGTYGDVRPGAAIALIGSDGTLEIAVRDGSAAQVLGLERGAPVSVQLQ